MIFIRRLRDQKSWTYRYRGARRAAGTTMRRFLTQSTALVGVTLALAWLPQSALADVATPLINHGPVSAHFGFDDGNRHPEYGIYDGQVFFTLGGTLKRYSPETGETVEIEILNGMPLTYDMPPARFTAFDGSLFFHLDREFPAGRQRLLFRMDSPDGPAVQVENHRMHTTPMHVYEGALYFFIARTHPFGAVCDFSDQVFALYRVDNSGAAPLEVAWNHGNTHCDSIADFTSGPDGLLFRGNRESTRSNMRDSVVYQIKAPVSATELPLLADSDGVALSIRIKASRPLALINYQDHLFYAGEHLAFTAHPDFPLAGPTLAPGPVISPVDPIEIELYRVGPEGGDVYFDLHPKSQPEIFDLWTLMGENDIGSSDPSYFAKAQDALYFQASPDGQVPELYRLTEVLGEPELISLSPNLASNAQPIGEFDGRLWLQADSGAGYDIHYLAEDGRTAMPLLIGESVAQSARGFTGYGNGVLFTALNEAGDLTTWFVERPAAIEPPLPPEPGALSVVLEVNGTLAPTGSTSLWVDTKDRLDLRCVVGNNTEYELTGVRIVLRRVQVGGITNRMATEACKRQRISANDDSTCLRRTRALDGLWRYMCVAASSHPSGVRLRERAFAFIRAD